MRTAINIWPILWAGIYSLTWLIPVGTVPWPTFFSDILTACLIGCAGLALLVVSREDIHWHWATVACLFIAVLPFLQWWNGILPYFGQAWISALYLSGLGFCILIGGAWERCSPDTLLVALFSAIMIAAIASVGLQLYVWLGISENSYVESFFMPARIPRVAGALGQPNQLATLLLWAILSTLYFYIKKYIGSFVAVVLVLYFLTGLALTQSRTGVLNAVLITAALGTRWTVFGKNISLWSIVVLLLYLFFSPFLLEFLASTLVLNSETILDRLGQFKEIRIQAWLMLLESGFSRPWFGYGWSDVSVAQLMSADDEMIFGGIFKQSHNLFLDLILWVGVPLGFLISSVTLWMMYKLWKNSVESTSIILILILFVVGFHAMLEFPLHYAYFLAPTGLILGVALSKNQESVVLITRRWVGMSSLVGVCVAIGITAYDYLRIEEDFQSFRLMQRLKGSEHMNQVPISDVVVLDQLQEWSVLLRVVPRTNMPDDELKRLDVFALHFPSEDIAYKLAVAYMLNGYPVEAEIWFKRLCGFSSPISCLAYRNGWQRISNIK